MSREDLALHRASPDPSSSNRDSSGSSSYNEEDHRRLLFGLMRAGLTPQVELALRLIDEASHTSSRSHSHASSVSGDDEDDEEYLDSADEYEEEEDEDEDELDNEGDEENSPALTTKPLRNNNAADNERAPRAWGWAYSKSDDQQQQQQNASTAAGQPYVERWLADVHGRSEVLV